MVEKCDQLNQETEMPMQQQHQERTSAPSDLISCLERKTRGVEILGVPHFICVTTFGACLDVKVALGHILNVCAV